MEDVLQDGTRRFQTRTFVALLMFLALVSLAITGLGLHEISESGGGHGDGRLLLGMSRHGWMSTHVALGIAFVAATAGHLAYNWRPLWRSVRPVVGGHARLGVELLAAVAAVAVLVAVTLVHQYLG